MKSLNLVYFSLYIQTKYEHSLNKILKIERKNEMEIEKEKPVEKNNSFFFEPNKEEPIRWNYNENYIECQFCQKKFLDDDVKNFWYFFDFKAIIQKEKLDKMNQELLEIQFNIITCFKCQEKFEFVEGKADPKTKDEKGRLLTS